VLDEPFEEVVAGVAGVVLDVEELVLFEPPQPTTASAPTARASDATRHGVRKPAGSALCWLKAILRRFGVTTR
jgi:hypothetical protein